METSVLLQLKEGCRQTRLEAVVTVGQLSSMWQQLEELSLCRSRENGKGRRYVRVITIYAIYNLLAVRIEKEAFFWLHPERAFQ